MEEDIKKFIDDNWDDLIIKNERSFRQIRISSVNYMFCIFIDYDSPDIKINNNYYNKNVTNYLIDKIKSLILNELIVDNEIYVKKYTSYTNSFKRRRYSISYRLITKQFSRSPIIETAVLIIEKNRLTNKIVKAYITYACLTIPINLNKVIIKFV